MSTEKTLAAQVTYNLSGKTVLVIGGTTGIGRSCALAFAKAGANLWWPGWAWTTLPPMSAN